LTPANRARWRDILGAAFAGTLVVVLCLLVLRREPYAFWVDDYQISILPVFADMARSWSEGTLPLLSPYSWVCGNLAGEFQYGTFSVFVNAAVVVVWKFALSFPQQAAAMSITHLAVLASGGFLLARGRGLHTGTATMVALVAALNGWIVAWGASDWFGALAAFTWLPWSWWALEYALRGDGPRWRVLLPAPFIYLLIAGGFPYTILMLLVVTGWLALHTLAATRDWRSPLRMAPGWLLGVGLAAPAWWSLIEMSRGSRRATETFAARQWMVPFDGLPGFILPAWTVDWVQFEAQVGPHPALELACGFAPAVVIVAAAVILRKRFLAANGWLLGLLAFVLLVCMLPGAGIFRFSFRWLPLVHVVLALLAGAALEQWLASARASGWWNRANLGLWALGLVIPLIIVMLFGDQPVSVDNTMLPLWFSVLAACWWAIDGALRRAAARQWLAAGVTFAALLLTYRDMGTSGPVARYPFQDSLNTPAPLATDRLYLSLYRAPHEVYTTRDLGWSVGETLRLGSTSMFAGVHLINGYSPISPAGVGRLFDFGTHGQINRAKVDELVIDESGPDGLLAELGIDGIIVAWDFDMPGRLPANWEVVTQWSDGYVLHRDENLAHVRARKADGLATADVRIIENSRHRVVADVTPDDTTRPVALLFSRPFFPGYKARLNGTAIPVTSYRGLIPAVEIPAGQSGRLELIYRPKAVTVGGAIAAASLVALAGAGLMLRKARTQ
jgi:hypothetical protein